ncbi:DUF3592 domain-containing protein [Teredinibacter franksiae]|uniref:DUF3592 domain-containing protein n=1 Tax=Teredinibacter franksiae TaxID=2761453 RepID=UPI0016236E42
MEYQELAKLTVFILLIAFTIRFWPRWRKSFLSKYWPTAPGKVVSSALTKSGNDWIVEVTYSYEYRGRQLTSDVLTIFGVSIFSALTKKSALNEVDFFYEGKVIDVYVNPQDPKDAVVIPGFHWTQFVGFIAVELGLFYIIFFY